MWQVRLALLWLCVLARNCAAATLLRQRGTAHGRSGPFLVPVLHDLDAAWASSVYSALPPRVRACTVSFRHVGASEALRELCAAAATDPTSTLAVGASTICSEEQVWAAKRSGATFISTMYFSPRIVEVAVAAQLSVLGGVVNHAEARTTIDSGVDSLKFYPSSTVSPLSLTRILEQLGKDDVKERDILVAGGLTEDDFQKYLAAGATGFAVGIDCKSLPDSSQGITAKLNTLFLALDSAILNLKGNVNAY